MTLFRVNEERLPLLNQLFHAFWWNERGPLEGPRKADVPRGGLKSLERVQLRQASRHGFQVMRKTQGE